MAFVGCPGGLALCSDPIPTKVGKQSVGRAGSKATNVNTATSTVVTQGSDSKINGGTTTLYYSPTPGKWVPAATTSDGGKTWTHLKDSKGKDILGADAKKSLEQGALKTNTQAQIQSATKDAAKTPEEKAKLSAGAGTKAGPAGPVGAGSSDATAAAQKQQLDDELKGTQSRSGYGDAHYPEKLNPQHHDVIRFTMLEYKPRGLGSTETTGVVDPSGQSRQKDRKLKGTVTLPIPGGISDGNQAGWGDNKMELEDSFLSQLTSSFVQTGDASKPLDAAGKTLQKNNPEVKDVVAGKITKEITGVDALARERGAMANNNLELLFNGPTLRSFTFTFRMSPRNKTESDSIMKIIRFFKQGMAPKKSKGALYLKFPDTFNIEYLQKGKLSPYLNKFKECALTSCNVSYTPDGQYTKFFDGPMTVYEMTLAFQELEPIFDSDYSNNSNEIGY